MSLVKRTSAHAFQFGGGLAELKTRLEAVGPWSWTPRDSDYFGDYLSTRARPDEAVLKIYGDSGRGYQVDIFFEADGDAAEAAWQRFHDDIVKRLLPSIGATDVEDTDTMN